MANRQQLRNLPTAIMMFFVILESGCSPDGNRDGQSSNEAPAEKFRVIVSTDIGGTDPDDFQSMIHYLMYADKFHTEGLIASPYGAGRKEDILKVIDLYEKDFSKLKKHGAFPEPNELRSVVKQGSLEAAPAKGWDKPTEGSEWIVKRAKAESSEPLWILVWGGLGDVAQALHDAPEIMEKLRVYWIGGPNKKWGVHAYLYLARNFPDLWMIEANSTYRGWFIDSDQDGDFGNTAFYKKHIKNRGELGKDFGNHYGGRIKMGDTPSMAYLLKGNPDNPEDESWGGSFERLPYSAVRRFERHTALFDSIPTYSVIEWVFRMPKEEVAENPEIWMEIAGQRIDGFYDGHGVYKVRFVPKRAGTWKYVINSSSKKLHGQSGGFTSANPWPGEPHPDNVRLNNWWSDKQDDDLYLGIYQGAKTISTWRRDYLSDWAERLSWLGHVNSK